MSEGSTISIPLQVGNQSFRVRIPPEEKEFYEQIARFTQETFDEVSGHSVSGGPQVWAMTAFQIASELLECREELGETRADKARIERLIQRIEESTPSR